MSFLVGPVLADRFAGGGFDGYDTARIDTPFVYYGYGRFRGGGADGYDTWNVNDVRAPFAQISMAGANVVIDYTGGRTDAVYRVLAFNSNLANTAVVLYQVSETNEFSFIDTNALASVDRRFYRVREDVGGTVTTNPWSYTVFRKTLASGSWTKFALGINFGDSNRLDSTLGIQLAQGLNWNNNSADADLLYAMDATGGWAICYPNGSGAWREYPTSASTNLQVNALLGFWIKRKVGSAANPVYSGYCFTEVPPSTFRSNDWHMITWPFAADRSESSGSVQGWGFSAAGAQKGTSWINSDLLTVGEDAALRFYYLNTNGRWCAVGQSTPASSLSLHSGDSYYYMHRGTGFVWTAQP